MESARARDGRSVKPLVSSFVRRQSNVVPKHPLEDPRALLVLEDCCEHADLDDPDMRSLFVDHRSTRTTVMVALPHPPCGLCPCVRDNIDYVCIFPEHGVETRQDLWEEFARGDLFPTFDTFCDALDRHACLIIDNAARCAKLFRWSPMDT